MDRGIYQESGRNTGTCYGSGRAGGCSRIDNVLDQKNVLTHLGQFLPSIVLAGVVLDGPFFVIEPLSRDIKKGAEIIHTDGVPIIFGLQSQSGVENMN